MTWYFAIFIFISSCFLLSWLGSRLIATLIDVAKYLQWKEFVITFFIIAFASSLPNFFVDFNAVIRGMPEIAFGDIIGGNLADLTLILGIAVLFTKRGISADSKMVQKSAIFNSVIAVLPLLLIFDGHLSRIDGLVLIGAFFLYTAWIFSEESRFKKVYQGKRENPIKDFKSFAINLSKVILFLLLLLGASYAVVNSARYFAESLGISLALVGLFIVALGNTFPEAYFSIVSARKTENWMVLGELMGSIIICSTLVLGLIALFHPFTIQNLTPFFLGRVFLIVAVVLSLLFIRTGQRITKKEGLILILVYITFLLTEIFI